MNEGRIAINNTEINYRIDGPSDAPGVVLGNSLATNYSMWDAQIDALTERYRVLRYDKRGHGASEVGNAEISIESLADDVVVLARELDFLGGHFVGLSIGGMVGQALGINHPETFRSLTLCATTSRIPEEAFPIWEGRISTAKTEGMDALVEPTLQRWFTDTYRAAEPIQVAQVGQMVVATSVAGYVRCSRAIMKLNYTERLNAISAPTLVVPGERDPALPVSMSEVIAAEIPGAQMEVVEGAAHLCNIEQAGAFNRIVRGFLDRQPG